MAKAIIQHRACGCRREIDSPGPEDPEGLLAGKAAAEAVHYTPHPCLKHTPAPPQLLQIQEQEKLPDGLPSAEDLDAVAAEQSSTCIDPGTPTGALD